MLRTAAILNILLAIAHIAVMPWLDKAFEVYGIEGEMGEIAQQNPLYPYLVTIVIACCFALSGVYALSAEGKIGRMPLLWTGIFFTAAVFLLRAVIGIYWIADNGRCPFTDISSVMVSGGIGLLYLKGGISRLKQLKTKQNESATNIPA